MEKKQKEKRGGDMVKKRTKKSESGSLNPFDRKVGSKNMTKIKDKII